MALQSQLEDKLVRVQANSTTLQRFQLFEKELLNLNTLVEMVEYVLITQDFFDLDYIGICLDLSHDRAHPQKNNRTTPTNSSA
jgi:hypothetical protein